MNLNFWNVLCALVCVSVSEAMRQGDVGVCEIKTYIRKTRTETEIKLMRCGKGGRSICTRTVPKTMSYTEAVPTLACCEDYEWVDTTDTCRPICKHGCEGGTCVSPDNCKCEAPLIFINNACKLPECHPLCVNGNCTAPNTCTCHEGYQQKDNSTCVPQCNDCENGRCTIPNVCECNEGYTMIENKCKPVCKSGCQNGFCGAPDLCTCNDGYELRNGTCEPVCGACVNAKCIAPNTCECFAGFKAKSGHEAVCMPKCDSCENGECVAPNKCVCLRGYALANNVCRPTCKHACVYGKCTEPDKCTCYEGYTQNVTDPSICHKPCNDCGTGDCVDGECICGAASTLINGTCLLLEQTKASSMESTTTGLASLEMSWLVGGAFSLLLAMLVIVVIQRMWQRRKDYGPKTPDNDKIFGSVIYTLPDTLIRNDDIPRKGFTDEDAYESDEENTKEKLMTPNDVA